MSNELRERFQRLVAETNDALKEAHALGLTVFSEGNGYLIQLQQAELLKVNFGINDCEHDFRKVQSVEQETAGRKRLALWDFERCQKCSVTASVPMSYKVRKGKK